MRPLIIRSAVLLSCLFLAGVGCSKQARMERRLVRGDKLIAAGDFMLAESEYREALNLVPNDQEVLGRIGIMAYRQGKLQTAFYLLDGVRKNRPEDLDVQLAYGLTCLTLARTAEARLAAKMVLEKQPANEEALLLLAGTCETTRDNEESRHLIEQLRDRSKDTPGHHVALGLLRLGQRDQAGAEAEYRKALEMDPKSAVANAQLGNLLLARDDLKAAGAPLRQAAELSPLRSPFRIRYIEYLMGTGALADAQIALDKITTVAPDYIPAWSLKMKVAFQQGKYAESDTAAGKVLSLDRNNFEAMMQRAAIRLVNRDISGVIEQLQRVDSTYQRFPQVKYQLALAYLESGQKFLAEDHLQQAIRLSPNYDDAIVLMAELNLQKGNAAEVITALTRLLQRQPQNQRAYILLAQAYRAQGETNKSLTIFQRMVDVFPGAPDGPYLVGNILMEQDRRKEARVAFEQSVRLADNYWPAIEKLADLDLLEQRRKEAADRIAGLLKKYPNTVQPWMLRAKLRLATGDLDGCEKDLLKAIELDPKAPYPYRLLAEIYIRADRTKEALEKLTALASRQPDVNVLMQIGMLQEALKKSDDSRASYEKALAIDPNFSPALNNLAILCSNTPGQLDKANDLARQALKVAPNDPLIADTAGWIMFRLGQYDSALRPLQLAAEKMPMDPEILYHVGMASYFVGQAESARVSFRAALDAGLRPALKEEVTRRLEILALVPRKPDPANRLKLEAAARQVPSDPMALTRLAELDLSEGLPVRAAEHYEAVLKIQTREVPVMMALVQLYVGPLQKADRAREIAKLVRAVAPNDGQVSWKLGQLVYSIRDYAWAATMMQDAARFLPEQPELQFDLARSEYSIGRVVEAESALTKVLSAEGSIPVKERATRMASLIAAGKGASPAQGEVAAARQALLTEPDFVPALVVTAQDLERQKNFNGAAQVYAKILGIYPLFAPAMLRLAILHGEQLGDDKKAEAFALEAIKALPDDPSVNFLLGAVNYRRGEYSGAVRFLKQSLRSRDNHAETLYYLGMAYFQLKNSGESRLALQRALELHLPPQEETESRKVLEKINRGGGN